MRLFVYGTLKEGWPLFTMLPKPDKIERGRVCGLLYDLGPFPALELGEIPIGYAQSYEIDVDRDVEASSPGVPSVHGEVFTFSGDETLLTFSGDEAVSALVAADMIEGFDLEHMSPSLYERVLVSVNTEAGPVSAWTYRMIGAGKKNHPVIPSGVWIHGEGI